MALTSAPKVSLVKLSVPVDHILVITLNRPRSLNAVSTHLNYQHDFSIKPLTPLFYILTPTSSQISPDLNDDLGRTLAWFDSQPEIW